MSHFKYPKPGGVLALAASLVLTLACTTAVAAEKPPATQLVQGVGLVLNGSGTRVKYTAKVYDVALYTPSKVTTPEALFALPGIKRLNFVALRDVSGTELGLAFVRGLKANSPAEVVQKNTVSIQRMTDVFASRPKLVAGDRFSIDYLPGKGSVFSLLNQPQGAAIGDGEFFEMVLKIWTGPSPVDADLKAALLGK